GVALLRRLVAGLQKQTAAMGELVMRPRSEGYKVLVYGAAPRWCLLVSPCRIADMIDLVVDDRRDIHSRLMPGTSHVVRPLKDAAGEASGKLLCLLGVGAENEFKVRAKLAAAIDATVVFVSLLPPRNTLQTVAA